MTTITIVAEPVERRVPRESTEWIGPLTIDVEIDGEPVPVDPAAVRIAVLPRRERPVEADWLAPAVKPGGTALGIQADPVPDYIELGIWVRVSADPEFPVLDPDQVGYLIRT